MTISGKEINWQSPTAIEDLREILEAKSPADALESLTGLELSYRQSDPCLRHLPALNQLLNDQIYRAFQAHRKDPESVPLHPLYDAIDDTLRRRPDRRFLRAPLTWQAEQLDRWHAQLPYDHLTKSGSSTNHPKTVLQAIPLLLKADLFPWEGQRQPAYKRRLSTLLNHVS